MTNESLSSSDQETATTLISYFRNVFEPNIDKPLPEFPVRKLNASVNDLDIMEDHVGRGYKCIETRKKSRT